MPKKPAVANFVFRPKRYNLVTDKMAAKRISKMLLNPRIRHRYFAIDTETVGCDPTFQSPCKMAYMISASIYCGPDVNFGNGPYIWIENINEHLIKYFQPFFADPTIKKVFHNYSYDYHVLRNCNIIVNGFAADTLHMARLLDSDRLRYSLEVLTTDYLKRPKIPFKKLFPVPETALKEIRDSDNGGTKLDEDIESIDKDLIPEPFLLQINKKNRMKWIDYCVYDTEATWLLREKFESLLLKQHWGVCSTMYDLYKKVYVPFARLLVRMEERGFHIDVKGALSDSFENAFSIASKYADKFKKWAVKYEPNSENLNPRSYRQVQQLLFAPNSETDLHETKLKHDHIFNIENENNVILPGKKTPNKYLKGMGIKPVSRTATNRPQCNIEVIEKLAGTPYDRYPYYGIAIKHFADRKEGIKACKALYELCNLYKSEKLLNTYLETLGNHIDEDG